MSFPLIVDGSSYQYPSQGDKANTGWGTQTGGWASAVTSALTKLGLGGTLSPLANTVIDISSTSKGILIPRMTTVQRNAITSVPNSLLIFNTTDKVLQYYDSSVSSWISVGARLPDNAIFSGTLTVNGGITGATGNFTDVTDAVDVDTAPLKTAGGMAVKKKLFVGGVIYADDDTTANTPVISFTGDTNTGIGRSAADTIDLVTGGKSRAKLNSTGQQSSVIPDLSGSNTNLFNEYKCRAWVFANASSVIQKQGNVSTITDHGTGEYQVNFLVAMPDTNYAESIGIGSPSPNVTAGTVIAEMRSDGSKTANAIRFTVINISSGSKVDEAISLLVFR